MQTAATRGQHHPCPLHSLLAPCAVLEVHQFSRDASVAEAWLLGQEPYLSSREIGQSVDEVEKLIKRHEAFEKSAATWDERFSALERLTTVSGHWKLACLPVAPVGSLSFLLTSWTGEFTSLLIFLQRSELFLGVAAWHSRLRVQLCHWTARIQSSAQPSGVKDEALLQLWHRSQLQLGFSLWPRNFHLPKAWPE